VCIAHVSVLYEPQVANYTDILAMNMKKRHVYKQICHQVQWFVNMFSAPLSIEPVEKYVCKYNFMSLLLLLSPRTIMDPPALSLDR